MIRVVLVLLFVATQALAQDVDADVDIEAGLEAWHKVYRVFSHPRCSNCHVGSDRVPIWSEKSYGPAPRRHGMNIDGGPSGSGVERLGCASCHTKHNSQVPHGPPGAEVWRLPQIWMQWSGKSSGEICSQIKDPLRNGGLSFDAVVRHIGHDKLVQWAWDPGPGREAAPYSSAEVVEFLRKWKKESAPCPAD
jgi:hypothetical protein